MIGRTPVDLGIDGQIIDIAESHGFANGAESITTFCFDCRAVKALFRQADVVSQRISGDVLCRIFFTYFRRRFSHNQRNSRTAQYLFTLWKGNRFTATNHRIARFNKPDRSFRRGFVGGLLERFLPCIKLAAMVQRYGEDSAFHYHSSDSIILIINMLMITFIPDCVVWQK